MSMIENCSLTDNMENKAIRDQHRALFAEMVKKTGSHQSVLDRMLQELSEVTKQRDEFVSALESLLDMDVAYNRGQKVVDAVANAEAAIASVKGQQ